MEVKHIKSIVRSTLISIIEKLVNGSIISVYDTDDSKILIELMMEELN